MRTYQAYEYIRVKVRPPLPGRKTRIYDISSVRQEAHLGQIKWHGAWRQYCFFPNGYTIWSAGCLGDVNDFLARLKRERAEACKAVGR